MIQGENLVKRYIERPRRTGVKLFSTAASVIQLMSIGYANAGDSEHVDTVEPFAQALYAQQDARTRDMAESRPGESRQTKRDGQEGSSLIEEIVVTASKRGATRLQDIPMSITVVDQTRIDQAGIDDFLDYARMVPGLGFQFSTATGNRDDISGGRRLNMRGIESGFDGVPTVAFYLDDSPVPIMDPKLFDVARVEVLRGPQGTLYGANSMGGTLRVVMNKPQMNELDYRADVTLKTTKSGDESTIFNGMINMPLIEDRIALRGVAFYRNEGGYIDHVRERHPSTTDVDINADIDDEESWGIRFAADLQATTNLRFTPSVFHQETHVDDIPFMEPGFQDLSVFFQKKVPNRQNNDFTLYNLETSYQISDNLELFSSTSYFESQFSSIEDLTRGFFGFSGPTYFSLGPAGFFGVAPPVGGPVLQRALQSISNERFSEELRLSYTGDRWNGVFGVFYMEEDRFFDQDFPSADGSTPILFTGIQSNSEEQTAVFGEATYRLTDRIDLTAGIRWFDGTQGQFTRFVTFGSVDILDGDASDSSISPKAQLSYHIDEDKMMYASATRGFRPGGPTSVVPANLCSDELAELGLSAPPEEFESDSLWSYEIGTKSSFADRRFTLNAAAYYIDWTDVQQSIALLGDCGFTFVGNVAAADSRGVELEFSAVPVDGLSLSGSVGYTDAEFTESAPGLAVEAGDRLQLVPKWTASAAAHYTFATFTGHTAYLRGDFQYKDSVINGAGEGSSEKQASHVVFNAHMGVTLTEHLELVLSAENILDRRHELFIVDDSGAAFMPTEFRRGVFTSRPRSFGLTFRYRR